MTSWAYCMLKISKLADYATVIMQWLSTHDDDRFSAAMVSERIGIAVPTVSKVLKLLSDAGLVVATRGAQGGYVLSRPARAVSIAEIITAIDGQLAMTECSVENHACRRDQCCDMRSNWRYINNVVFDVLSRLTLHDMTVSSTLPKET